jgi:hypothetical protein
VAPDLAPLERAALGEEEMRHVERMCLCPMCPTYPKEDVGVKKAYCLRGDSDHKDDIEPKDCLCESCEVYKHGKLYGSNYFCMEGAALAKGLRNVLKGRVVTGLAEEKEFAAPAMFVSAGLDVHEKESKRR